MPKINQEEYEILKELDDKWKWIARDEDDKLRIHNTDTSKRLYRGLTGNISHLFQFIQEKELYFIAELIEEYEFENVLSDEERFHELYNVNESEETEVKKNKEWLKRAIKEYAYANYGNRMKIDISEEELDSIINQLVESETPSEPLGNAETFSNAMEQLADELNRLGDLERDIENLTGMTLDGIKEEARSGGIVPKHEKVKIPYFIEEHIQSSLNYSEESTVVGKIENYMLPRIDETELDSRVLKFFNTTENIDLVALAMITENYEVEEEQKYVIKLDDESYLQRYEIDNKNIVTPFRIVGHLKEVAIKFENKERAEKVAELVEGKVEEMEE